MRRAIFYISDDGKKQSSDIAEVQAYEERIGVPDRTKVCTFTDVNNLPATIYKLEKPTDLAYLADCLHLTSYHVRASHNYIGCVVLTTDSGCNRELVSADRYIKETQSRIDELNAEISTIKNHMK